MDGNMTKFMVGDRVRIVRRHWLRSGHEGLIIACEPKRQNIWLVEFDTSYPGGGIDGNKLYLDAEDMILVVHAFTEMAVAA